MCLGVPGIVRSVSEERAEVDVDGVVYNAGLHLVEGVEVGDYVLVHSGYILEKLEKEDALQTLKLFEELRAVDNS